MAVYIDADLLSSLASDPLVFAESFLIEPRTHEPFRANYVQRKLLGAVPHANRIAVRVSRQTGKTYGLTVLAIWAAVTRPRTRVLVVAPDLAKVKVIFDNIDAFLDSNPAIKASLTRSYSQNPHIGREFSNGSAIVGFTTGSSSNKKATSIRGQGADVIIVDEAAYLSDEDWLAINPIIQGGLYRTDTLAVVSSTPRIAAGTFYELFTNPNLAQFWHRIHVPITENPDFEGRVEQIRASVGSELEWVTEFLADFPDAGLSSFFGRSHVERAQADYHYDLYRVAAGPKAIGVDWDIRQAGVNIVICRFDPHDQYYEVYYREEVRGKELLLTEAVRRVLDLWERTSADWIVVDRGFGQMQYEVLMAETRRRSMALANRVIGLSFSNLVTVQTANDPDGTVMRLKSAVMNWISYLLEHGALRFSVGDAQLVRQLLSLEVAGKDKHGYKFKDGNDHIVAAMGLALWVLKEQNPHWKPPARGGSPVVIEPARRDTVRVVADIPLPNILGAGSGPVPPRSLSVGSPVGRSFTKGGISRRW